MDSLIRKALVPALRVYRMRQWNLSGLDMARFCLSIEQGKVKGFTL